MTDTKLVNVRLPAEIVQWLDTLVDRGVYKSRSEALRDFCRDYVITKGGN